MKDLTVVVTNFKREQYLRVCLKSVQESGIKNVVLTSSQASPATEKLAREFQTWFAQFRFTNVPQDLGNNEAWLRGLRLVKTKWVYILHDDDVMIPAAFKKMWPRIRHELVEGRVPIWKGQVVQGNRQIGENDPLAGMPVGMHPSRAIIDRLHRPQALSISPVLGIFETAQAKRTLAECEAIFKASPQSFYTRPNMMVGNDMLLWLHAAEAHPEIYRFNEAIAGHGYHKFSETVSAFNNASALHRLQRCYFETQKYHRTHRYGQFHPGPAIYHLVPGHPTRNPDTIRRNQLADASWAPIYHKSLVTRLPVERKHLRRDATVVGEKKDMPFVRDIFDYAVHGLEDHDWIIYTNRDICICPEALFDPLGPIAKSGDCFYSHRRDAAQGTLQGLLKRSDFGRLRPYPGADLFAMRAHWWKRWRSMMPDMLVGFEAWDYVLWTIMDFTNGGQADYTPLIYHEWHQSHWENNKTTTPGQKHNRRLAKNFLCTRFGYKGNLE